ncbi:hypothetical protein L1887_38663 [Cichorium endivia]|nr:hypothetical protein L1887_38663 [Cichorium endivia]
MSNQVIIPTISIHVNIDLGNQVIVAASPSTEDALVAIDPLTKEDLVGYLSSGCKPKENWSSSSFLYRSLSLLIFIGDFVRSPAVNLIKVLDMVALATLLFIQESMKCKDLQAELKVPSSSVQFKELHFLW